MRATYRPESWIVFYCDSDRMARPADPVIEAHAEVLNGSVARSAPLGQPFLIGPSGRPDQRVNAFFSSRRVRRMSPLTWRKYAQSLGLWLNFLSATGRSWDEAGEEDAEYFKEWRLREETNPWPVEGSTFRGNLAALRAFYVWAAREYGVANPVAGAGDFDLTPRGVRESDVKWLDPGGYTRWRDLGLRGLDCAGRADRRWRGRNAQRDAAFADGLYSTGLRLTEWASVLVTELPGDDAGRGFFTCVLADSCAKGGYGHKYWISRMGLLGVLAYEEGSRARAVRGAQQAGRYERLRGLRRVVGQAGQRLRVVEPDGRETSPAVSSLGPAARRRLFRAAPGGLEPLALWLNEDGLPRAPHAWHHTFTQANDRIAGLGLAGFRCTPHMLRHSCALRWYSVGRLAYEARFGHLEGEEARDFREQFGSTWDLVATILGHRNPETTRRHYLEPFRHLEVELLLHHAQEVAVDRFLASYLAGHPRVRTDPLGAAR